MSPGRPRAPKKDRDDVLARRLRETEKATILEYLKKNDGNVTSTAKALGLSDRALYDKLVAYDLQEAAAKMRAGAGISGPR